MLSFWHQILPILQFPLAIHLVYQETTFSMTNLNTPNFQTSTKEKRPLILRGKGEKISYMQAISHLLLQEFFLAQNYGVRVEGIQSYQ